MKSGTNPDSKSSNQSFDGFRNVRLFIAVLLAILLGIVVWQSRDLNRQDNHRTLTIYCFTGMEEMMENAIFPAFKDYWQEKTGENIEFIATFAGSGDITRKIISRFPVEIAIFASELDAVHLSNRGIPFLQQGRNLPYNGVLNRTPLVILTQSENSFDIRDFEDLTRSGLDIVYPDPSTSGAGHLGLIAIYGARILAGDTEMEALENVQAVWRNVVDKPSSAVVNLLHFREGNGDVMITYESNLLENPKRPQITGQIIYPQATILCEPTVRAIKNNVSSSQEILVEAFISFLWSDTAQTAFTQYGAYSVIETLNSGRPNSGSLQNTFTLGGIGSPYELDQIVNSVFNQ